MDALAGWVEGGTRRWCVIDQIHAGVYEVELVDDETGLARVGYGDTPDSAAVAALAAMARG